MWQEQTCPHMPYICHIPKSLDIYQWGKYANVYTIYELTDNKHVTRNCTQMLMMPMQDDDDSQPDYIYSWPPGQSSQKAHKMIYIDILFVLNGFTHLTLTNISTIGYI